MNRVFVKKLRIYAFHGVLPQENVVGAYFTIDISIDTDFNRAMATDELDGTISYADICDTVKQEMAITSKLLEHVAGRICNALFSRFPSATKVKICITKENPPMGVECGGAGVEVEQDR